jgi:hypothetical protein
MRVIALAAELAAGKPPGEGPEAVIASIRREEIGGEAMVKPWQLFLKRVLFDRGDRSALARAQLQAMAAEASGGSQP